MSNCIINPSISTTEAEIKAHMKVCATSEAFVQWILHKLKESYVEGVRYMADRAVDIMESETGMTVESKLN